MDLNVIQSGFIAGTAQTLFGHPFDTIKTRLQIKNGKILANVKNLLKKEGGRAFYKGSFLPLLSGCVQNSVLFGTENYFYNYTGNNFMSGFIAGGFSSLIITPSELIKCKIQNEKRRHLKITEILKNIHKRKYSLYTGFYGTFLRETTGMAVYYGLYNYLQSFYNNPFLNGGLSGISMWAVSYPFDIMKTRKQIYTDMSYNDIIKKIKFRESLKGLNIVLQRAFIVNAGIFYLFEKTSELKILS